jgi:N-acetyl-anhydromuramyl-L-alanine amidase AmpD
MDRWNNRGTYAAWHEATRKLKENPVSIIPSRKRLLSEMTSAQRKEYPIVTGVLDYFPDAIAMVAHVSYLGNQKHNPGEKLHWSRGKSADHLDCIGRHLTEREEIETDNIPHMANAAWRALAELQEALERKHGLSLPNGAK